MKQIKSIVAMCLMLSALPSSAQDQTEKIRSTITASAKAADESNSEKLALYLDENFRIVMNRLFGSTEVKVMSKAVYLEKIKSKEFGGDDRKVTVENIVINSNSAAAKVTFKGTKMTFNSIILLIRDQDGNWKLTSETPVVS